MSGAFFYPLTRPALACFHFALGNNQGYTMETKSLELRDDGTFIPVICVRPVPENEGQRYLLRRDGYAGHQNEHCIIMIDAQCRGVAYDPYDWPRTSRTKHVAHLYIRDHWPQLKDGDVIDVQFILGETSQPKTSERATAPV